MKYKPMPSIELLHSKFELDAKRGVLIRKTSHTNHRAGEVCGTEMKSGHLVTGIGAKRYLVHRIIYYMATGVDPLDSIVDHKDGDPANNSIDNLRLATTAENGRHKVKLCTSNTSGHRNVSWNKINKVWMVSLTVSGKRIQRAFNNMADAVKGATELRVAHYGNFAGLTA